MNARDPVTFTSHETVLTHFEKVRAATSQLASVLSDEDCCVQSMPDASPVKWHLAHTTWFFETFVLEHYETNFEPFQPMFRMLFNSYYNSIGEKHPRPQRGMITRPSLADVYRYRNNVDERMQRVLAMNENNKALQDLVVLGLHHEQQHQELILTDIKHLFSLNPLKPAYNDNKLQECANATKMEWISSEGGLVEMGCDGNRFCFDNEQPRHQVYLQPYSLASRLITNGEYLNFIEDGGYQNSQLWLSDGWNWIIANDIKQPLYWSKESDIWREFTLHGVRPLDPNLPVVHVSYFEADAYARWANARLPTEAEWEHLAAQTNIDDSRVNCFHPSAASGSGLQQLYGDAWQWTQSSYAPYPGFRPGVGAIGEYNGKFMVNQYVLRGGSCVTPANHTRESYRNFFPTAACWQFSGIRLARDD